MIFRHSPYLADWLIDWLFWQSGLVLVVRCGIVRWDCYIASLVNHEVAGCCLCWSVLVIGWTANCFWTLKQWFDVHYFLLGAESCWHVQMCIIFISYMNAIAMLKENRSYTLHLRVLFLWLARHLQSFISFFSWQEVGVYEQTQRKYLAFCIELPKSKCRVSLIFVHDRDILQESLANAKVNARQHCVVQSH